MNRDNSQFSRLQHDVIQRLRSAGYESIAECAAGCWESGAPCLFSVTLHEASPPGITPELAADFERANLALR